MDNLEKDCIRNCLRIFKKNPKEQNPFKNLTFSQKVFLLHAIFKKHNMNIFTIREIANSLHTSHRKIRKIIGLMVINKKGRL